MWKIRQLLIWVFTLSTLLSLRAHPVSVMTGDALWAENQLIINMQMTMDNLLLHFQIPVDEDGYLSSNYLNAAVHDFEKLLKSHFEIKIPETVLPQVTLSSFSKKYPGKIKRADLRECIIEFELRFICQHPANQLTLVQTMGDRSRGLQSTSLITFHFGGVPQLTPVYNNIGVKIDLENQVVLEEKVMPIFKIDQHAIVVSLPDSWVTHTFPFELEVGSQIISGTPQQIDEAETGWSGFVFYLPEGAKDFNIRWNSFNWQMRRIELLLKKANSEQVVTLSRFNPDFGMEL